MKFVGIFLLLIFIHSFVCETNNVKISGGSEAPINAFPWMVSMRLNVLDIIKRDCGGVIVSDIFILTAASCFQEMVFFVQYYTIKAGIQKIGGESEPTEQVRTVSSLLVHPNYTGQSFLNDLALARISPPFNFNSSSVSPISLSNLTSLENMDLITLGWGAMNQSYPTALALQQVTVKENIECTQNKSINPLIQLCASGTCLGDSGGPLMIYSNDSQQYELVGITSIRTECTTEGLFTRTAPSNDWILGILENPPVIPTFPTLPPTIPTTTAPDILGPPIPFVCNTSYSCGCSPIPVIFHDEPPFPPTQRFNQGRIVGGETVQPHSWPWMVSLRNAFFGHQCGGALINDEWVVTAAHCLPNAATIIHIGVHDETLPSPLTRTLSKAIIHPNYISGPRFINDIALLQLSSPVNFTASAAYAGVSCLPPANAGVDYPKVSTRLAVIGWGRLASGGSRPTRLRQVRVMTLANDDWRCANSSFDKDRQFCAMVDGGGKDACQADSGGPIHQWLDDHWEQVGIVSYGTGCALANHPGVYTRLSFYHDWIQSTINGINETTTVVTLTTTTTIVDTSTANITTSNIIDLPTPFFNTAVVLQAKLFFGLVIYVGLEFFFINSFL